MSDPTRRLRAFGPPEPAPSRCNMQVAGIAVIVHGERTFLSVTGFRAICMARCDGVEVEGIQAPSHWGAENSTGSMARWRGWLSVQLPSSPPFDGPFSHVAGK